MSIQIQALLGSLRPSPLDNRDEDDPLERLVQRMLQEAKLYRTQYDEVGLWKEWPEWDDRWDTVSTWSLANAAEAGSPAQANRDVSVETMRIVDALPPLNIIDEENS